MMQFCKRWRVARAVVLAGSVLTTVVALPATSIAAAPVSAAKSVTLVGAPSFSRLSALDNANGSVTV